MSEEGGLGSWPICSNCRVEHSAVYSCDGCKQMICIACFVDHNEELPEPQPSRDKEEAALVKVGLQVEATKFLRGVGGKAFPNDYNWLCTECGSENRAFESVCPNCTWFNEYGTNVARKQ